MNLYRAVWLACLAVAVGFSPALGGELALWRGPRGDGTSQEHHVPTHWSGEENVAWKVDVPGTGHASPIVWGDRLFLVSCLEEPQERILLASTRPAAGCCGSRSCCNRRWKTSTSSTASPRARRRPTASRCTSRFSTAARWSWRPTTSTASRSGSCGPAGFRANTAIAVARCCSRTR